MEDPEAPYHPFGQGLGLLGRFNLGSRSPVLGQFGFRDKRTDVLGIVPDQSGAQVHGEETFLLPKLVDGSLVQAQPLTHLRLRQKSLERKFTSWVSIN